VLKNGGISRHVAFVLLILVCIVFIGIAPFAHYSLGIVDFHGIDIAGWQMPVLWLYTLAVFSMNLGYWGKYFWQKPSTIQELKLPEAWVKFVPSFISQYASIILCFGSLGGILIDMYASLGVMPWQFLNPFDTFNTYLYLPKFGGLRSLANILIVTLLIEFTNFRSKGYVRYVLIVVTVYSLFVLGFRYYIFLVVLALTLHWLASNANTKGMWLKIIAGGAIIIYMALFLTLNRWNLGHKDFAAVDFNPFHSSTEQVLIEVSNCQTDACLMKYMVQNDVPHDWGQSSVGYSVVRFLPAQIFLNQKKPFPPVFNDMMAAVKKKKLFGFGALTLPMEYWYGFGTVGMALFMALLGVILASIPIPASYKSFYSWVYCLGITVLYQWVSRGYTPQQVELLSYWAVGFLFLLICYQAKNRQACQEGK
jgi:hypothetical protein